jgi:hypothetical protein
MGSQFDSTVFRAGSSAAIATKLDNGRVLSALWIDALRIRLPRRGEARL